MGNAEIDDPVIPEVDVSPPYHERVKYLVLNANERVNGQFLAIPEVGDQVLVKSVLARDAYGVGITEYQPTLLILRSAAALRVRYLGWSYYPCIELSHSTLKVRVYSYASVPKILDVDGGGNSHDNRA